jgi:hypothetical protein
MQPSCLGPTKPKYRLLGHSKMAARITGTGVSPLHWAWCLPITPRGSAESDSAPSLLKSGLHDSNSLPGRRNRRSDRADKALLFPDLDASTVRQECGGCFKGFAVVVAGRQMNAAKTARRFQQVNTIVDHLCTLHSISRGVHIVSLSPAPLPG